MCLMFVKNTGGWKMNMVIPHLPETQGLKIKNIFYQINIQL